MGLVQRMNIDWQNWFVIILSMMGNGWEIVERWWGEGEVKVDCFHNNDCTITELISFNNLHDLFLLILQFQRDHDKDKVKRYDSVPTSV